MAELTHKTHGREVLATRDGFCKLCPQMVYAGEDYVAKVDGLGWCHALCAIGYCKTVNEDLEQAADLGDVGKLSEPYPVERCGRPGATHPLAGAGAVYVMADSETDSLVVLCDRCVRELEAAEPSRFKVVPL